ncbi:MAG: hypothetical protein AAFO80_08205 [Pseudomonadota bacterium]
MNIPEDRTPAAVRDLIRSLDGDAVAPQTVARVIIVLADTLAEAGFSYADTALMIEKLAAFLRSDRAGA